MDEPLSFLLDRRMDFANDPDPSTAGLAFLDRRLRSQLLCGAVADFRPLVVGVALAVVEPWFGPLVVVAVARQFSTSGCAVVGPLVLSQALVVVARWLPTVSFGGWDLYGSRPLQMTRANRPEQ